MSTHTHGPWEIIRHKTQIGECFRVGNKAVMTEGHGGCLLYNDSTSLNPHRPGEQEANATLISAAPDMYAVLKSMEAVDDDPMAAGDPRRLLLLAAIAKAEGKTA